MRNKITYTILAILFLTTATPINGKTIVTIETTVTSKHASGSYQLAKPSEPLRIEKTPKATIRVVAPAPSSTNRIFDTIHMLESTRGAAPSGHHIYCRNRSEWNEIGYNPQGKYCFKSEQEAREKVERWFQNKFDKGFTVAEAACMWNIGVKTGDCPYGKHF